MKPSGKITDANSHAQVLLQCPVLQLVGKNIKSFIPEITTLVQVEGNEYIAKVIISSERIPMSIKVGSFVENLNSTVRYLVTLHRDTARAIPQSLRKTDREYLLGEGTESQEDYKTEDAKPVGFLSLVDASPFKSMSY